MSQADDMPTPEDLMKSGQAVSDDEVARIIESTCVDYDDVLCGNTARCAEVMNTILDRLSALQIAVLATSPAERAPWRRQSLIGYAHRYSRGLIALVPYRE